MRERHGASNSPTTNVGGEHPNINAASSGANDPLVTGLRAMGHTVSVNAQSSGIATIVRTPTALQGGADPRREGLVLGIPSFPECGLRGIPQGRLRPPFFLSAANYPLSATLASQWKVVHGSQRCMA